jgi:hypothetical protein
MISTRNQIIEIINPKSIGCELGVFEGDFSKILIDSKKFDLFYIVDIFSGTAMNFGKVYHDASLLQKVIEEKFKEYNNIKIIKNDSLTFLKSVQNNYFDFIYIDTIHSYEQTIQELNEAYRVTRSGGLVCGHDYNIKEFPGVCKAVAEFCTKHSLTYRTTNQDYYESFIITISK